ncbi:MAG: arylsulfatase [Akkermansiaceae bacterium]
MKLASLLWITLGLTLGLASPRPNIVFILADDLGYGEVGCFGQTKIKTPHIDRLAKEGIRLTRHYTGAPVCAPARCVLLTGKHLANAEIRNNRDSGKGGKFPGQFPISTQAITLAETLKEAGYVTGGFGKWGLGPSYSSGGPNDQGFDRFYGYNCQRNAHSYYPPFLDDDRGKEVINKNPIPGHKRQPNGEVKAETYRAETYAPDRILEEALEFLTEHKDDSFFLYLPFVEPHVAIQAPQKWIDQYPAEWDEENGVYRGQNGYLPHPRPRAAYAAMISDLDEHIGAILARLDELKLAKNTIVVFTSDNGPTLPSKDPKFHVGGADPIFFNSTAGLRGWKGSVHEGGIRVPTIVRWPERVNPFATSDVPSYFPDWFPTLCNMTGTKPPAGLDGIDLTPALTGGQLKRNSPMIWEFHGYGGQIAITDWPWKAIRLDVAKKKPGKWKLYNLEKDPAEETDLSQKNPGTLASLISHFKSNRRPSQIFKLPLYDK